MSTPDSPGGPRDQLHEICELAAKALRLGPGVSFIDGKSRRYPFSEVVCVELRAATGRVAIVIKTFHDRVLQERPTAGDERAERSFRALQHVREFMPPVSGFTAAEPLAILGPCLAMRCAAGRAVEDLWALDSRSLETAYRSLGQWLERFATVPSPSAGDPSQLLESERRRVAANLAICASHGGISPSQRRVLEGRVDALAGAIEARPQHLRATLCHGDFIPINVFHGAGLTTAIDFETMRPGFWPRDAVSILVDVGLRSALNPLRMALGRRCSRAFLEGRGVSPAQVGDELFQLYLMRELTAQLVTRLEGSRASLRQRVVALYLRRVVLSLLLEPSRQWGCN